MTPEQRARVCIDALLQQAGWHVCNVADANIYAGDCAVMGVAIRVPREQPHTTPLSLRIFAAGGAPDPDGLRIVDKSNWIGKAMVFPRALLPQVMARPDWRGLWGYCRVCVPCFQSLIKNTVFLFPVTLHSAGFLGAIPNATSLANVKLWLNKCTF
ncbi:MAG: hypothetical protein ACT4NV_20240 [Rhodoferax sp.]